MLNITSLRLWHEQLLEACRPKRPWYVNLSYFLCCLHGEQGLYSDNNPVLECFGVLDVVLSATIDNDGTSFPQTRQRSILPSACQCHRKFGR